MVLAILLALAATGWNHLERPEPVWFWLAVASPILHQIYVWLGWRLQLLSSLTERVLAYAAAGLPVVFIGTWLGRHYAPPVGEETIKRGAYLLLLVMGVWILASAAIRAVA